MVPLSPHSVRAGTWTGFGPWPTRVTHGDELTFVHSKNSAPTNSTGEKEHVYEINGKRGCPDQRRRYCTCVFRDRRAIDERGKETAFTAVTEEWKNQSGAHFNQRVTQRPCRPIPSLPDDSARAYPKRAEGST